jgi:hypothetical protein
MGAQNEPPHHAQNNIPQCKRCQAYFHTKVYCAYRPICVKCGKSHSTEQCSLPKTPPATCLHCGESHPTSYRRCKFYPEIIRTRFSSPRTTASIHITNTQGQENEKLCSTTENWRTTKNDVCPSNQKQYRNTNNHGKQHTRTYTNQNSASVLHKVLNNLVQTSWTNEHAYESSHHRT